MNSLIEENTALKKENEMLEGYCNEWSGSNHIYEQQQQKLEEEIKKLKKENEKLKEELKEIKGEDNPHMMMVVNKMNEEFETSQKNVEFWKKKYNKLMETVQEYVIEQDLEYFVKRMDDWKIFDTKEELKEVLNELFGNECDNIKVYSRYEMIDREFDEEEFDRLCEYNDWGKALGSGGWFPLEIVNGELQRERVYIQFYE